MNIKRRSVMVAGVPYSIQLVPHGTYDTIADDTNEGMCDYTVKEIVAHDPTMEAREGDDMKNLEFITNNTVKHELVHAFLFETGNSEYAEDEKLVKLIALSIEKLHKLCADANAINSIYELPDQPMAA